MTYVYKRKKLRMKKGRTGIWMIINKRKDRGPITRISTYLKFGFVITEHEYHHCPKCNHILNAGPNYHPQYCDQCGQKLDFSKVKWKADKELGYQKGGFE